MNKEIKTPNSSIHFILRGPFPTERVVVYELAAHDLRIPFRIVPNEEIKDPFAKTREGMIAIELDPQGREKEFWNKVNELSKNEDVYHTNFYIRSQSKKLL